MPPLIQPPRRRARSARSAWVREAVRCVRYASSCDRCPRVFERETPDRAFLFAEDALTPMHSAFVIVDDDVALFPYVTIHRVAYDDLRHQALLEPCACFSIHADETAKERPINAQPVRGARRMSPHDFVACRAPQRFVPRAELSASPDQRGTVVIVEKIVPGVIEIQPARDAHRISRHELRVENAPGIGIRRMVCQIAVPIYGAILKHAALVGHARDLDALTD